MTRLSCNIEKSLFKKKMSDHCHSFFFFSFCKYYRQYLHLFSIKSCVYSFILLSMEQMGQSILKTKNSGNPHKNKGFRYIEKKRETGAQGASGACFAPTEVERRRKRSIPETRMK